MTDRQRGWDPWRGAVFLLWLIFFAVGLLPEPVFYNLREFAGVTTQRAWVNSPVALTLSFAGYIAWFTYNQCRAANLSPVQTRGNTLQIGVLALVAFLALPKRALALPELGLWSLMINASLIFDPYLRKMVYLAGIAKLGAWLYLFSLFLRYYLLGHQRAFATVFTLFPSARRERKGTVPGEELRQSGAIEPLDSAASCENVGHKPGGR